MEYNQPLDQPANPSAPYVDGNSAMGIKGSIIPAGALEYDQREIVEVIARANTRGYTDFADGVCAPAANTDLQQLRKAIEGFIKAWDFVIDTTVTFRVHGSSADFTDLIAAMRYLGKYRITPHGHVILQLAGATPTAGVAQQFVYTETIRFTHPNNDRISVVGAPMFGQLPWDDTGYASNGHSTAAQAADVTTNTGILRQKFATEIHFSPAVQMPDLYKPGAATIEIGGTALMDLDSILLTCDQALYPRSGFLFNCTGYTNYQKHHGGLAAIGFDFGFFFDVGACVAIQGEAVSIELLTTLVAIGSRQAGFMLINGGFVTSYGNAVILNGAGYGFAVLSRGGTQWDGGIFSCSNASQGIFLNFTENFYCYGTVQTGHAVVPSHYWKNGMGMYAQFANASCYADFGMGTANANDYGCQAVFGTPVQLAFGTGTLAGSASPPIGVIGNYNSIID